MNKIETNGVCTDCVHCKVCKNENAKQDLISALRKIDIDVQPFEIILKCPNFLKFGIGGPIQR